MLIGLAGAGAYVPSMLLAPLDEATVVEQAITASALTASAPAYPGYGSTAVGAVGFDGLLAEDGDPDPRPIASISKVVTALVVLDAHPLEGSDEGETITLSADDTALVAKYRSLGGKVEPMRAGWSFTQREVLEVMLVSSANNYAELLAGWAFGSQAAFVDAAGVWLTEHGLASTTITEPTGMSPRNTSTASDLVALGMLALQHPLVADIVGSKRVELPGIGTIKNGNDLLGIDGVDGIKTGTLDEAGACLLFATDLEVGAETVTVVGVVLGGVDHDSLDVSVQSLLASVEQGFHEVRVASEGDVFARFATEWGESADATAMSDISVLVWSDTQVAADIRPAGITTGARGDAAGQVDFTVGDELVSVDLELSRDLPGPDAWWRLTHPLELLPG